MRSDGTADLRDKTVVWRPSYSCIRNDRVIRTACVQ